MDSEFTLSRPFRKDVGNNIWHSQSYEDLKGGRRGLKRESLKMNLTHYFYPKASAFLQEAF